MSNLEPELTEELVDDSPVSDGQTADTTPTEDQEPPEPVREYIDIDDDLGNKWTKVKIDGEELDVQVKDLPQGYQRQEVFTRRTQEAAALRQQAQEALQLQQAFRADPGMTVQVLARNAGVSVEEFLGMTPREQQAATVAAADEYVDPLEREIAQERQERLALQERLDQRDADEYLRSQVNGLKQAYKIGDDEVRAVIQQALQMGVGPEAFPMIYQSQAYLKLQAQTQAQRESTAAQQADDTRRRAAAAAAAGTISSGTGATNVTTAPPANVHMSPRDAVLAAFSELER